MEPENKQPTPEEIGAELSGAAKVEATAASVTRAYLFLSFDLVNSTIFKQENDSWQGQISQFYQQAEHAVATRIANANIWKFAGDEVLFWISPRDQEEVFRTVDSAYEVLRWLDERARSDSAQKLRVKGTCWIALAGSEASAGKAPNLIFTHTSDAVTNARDFLGPEIDAGFRLGQHTLQGTLAISAELAAFLQLFAPSPLTKRIRLVTFLKLKGVWKNRFYPICWFRKDLEEGFEYDDRYEYPLLMQARNASSDGLETVVGIVNSMQPRYVERLSEALKRSEPEVVLRARQLEVHGVAVCSREDGRILMAKRSQSKKTLRGKWEFGCAQLRPGESFEDAIRRDYKAAFDAIVVDVDVARPLTTYSHNRDGMTIPGVILAARITNPDDCRKTKHDAISWVDIKNIPSEIADNAVPDLADVVAKLLSRSS